MLIDLPPEWRNLLAPEIERPQFKELAEFVDSERESGLVCPPEGDVFNAFKHTPFERVRVVFVGQDPYHGAGQAHGLCFSVRPGVTLPPSLVNIFKELNADLGCRVPNNGDLTPWADQGCLMLNAVLTVREGEPNSHKYKGWEKLTDAALAKVNELRDGIVFVLWGNFAIKRGSMIDRKRHTVLESAHPSPLSAHAGFFGSRPFSRINRALEAAGKMPIDWQLPDV